MPVILSTSNWRQRERDELRDLQLERERATKEQREREQEYGQVYDQGYEQENRTEPWEILLWAYTKGKQTDLGHLQASHQVPRYGEAIRSNGKFYLVVNVEWDFDYRTAHVQVKAPPPTPK